MITEQIITGVTRKNVTKRDGSTMVLFEIETRDGTTWTTAKEDLALEAHSRVGLLTAIDGTVKENVGKDRNGNPKTYTNHYLNALADAGDLNVTIRDTREVGNSIPEKVTYREEVSRGWAPTETQDERQDSIYRQVAAKVAAAMSGTSEEFWQNVEILIEFFRTGQTPSENKFIPKQEEKIPVGAAVTADPYDDLPF